MKRPTLSWLIAVEVALTTKLELVEPGSFRDRIIVPMEKSQEPSATASRADSLEFIIVSPRIESDPGITASPIRCNASATLSVPPTANSKSPVAKSVRLNAAPIFHTGAPFVRIVIEYLASGESTETGPKKLIVPSLPTTTQPWRVKKVKIMRETI
jgi:hypothetical protein